MKRIDIEPIIKKAQQNKGTIRIYLRGLGGFDIFRDLKFVDDILFREDLLIIQKRGETSVILISDIVYIEVDEGCKSNSGTSTD